MLSFPPKGENLVSTTGDIFKISRFALNDMAVIFFLMLRYIRKYI